MFEKVKDQQGFTLENQDERLIDFNDADIEDFLVDMFVSEDQFVVLTAPKAQNKVRYVQACPGDEGIELEIGIEDEGTVLYYKMCSEEECFRIFLAFYDNTFVPAMEEYELVEF